MSPISTDKIADLRAKELEMLQAVIARLANHGATLKNYCGTLTTASAGVALTLQRPAAIFLSLLPILICSFLDAQYLRNERRFRGLYHKIRKEDWSTPPTFNIGLSAAPRENYWSAFSSWSIVGFYGPLSIAVVAVALLAGHIYGKFL
jgi:hypothetical protein